MLQRSTFYSRFVDDGCDDTDDDDEFNDDSVDEDSVGSGELTRSRSRNSPSPFLSRSRNSAAEITHFRFSNPHLLSIRLLRGISLAARDRCGTSDPYVKFKVGPRTVYKSKRIDKTLDPVWDEAFVLSIQNLDEVVRIKVYDSNWGLKDDFIGMTWIDPSKLEIGQTARLSLRLEPESSSPSDEADEADEKLGEVVLDVGLEKVEGEEDEENVIGRNGEEVSVTVPLVSVAASAGAGADDDAETPASRRQTSPSMERNDAGLRLRLTPMPVALTTETVTPPPSPTIQTTTTTTPHLVTVVLREGDNLPAMDADGGSDPYVKLRLGRQKRKSKVKPSTLHPRWFQTFEFHVDSISRSPPLQLEVMDRNLGSRDDRIGGAEVAVAALEAEKTHHLTLSLGDADRGRLKLSVTLTRLSTDHDDDVDALDDRFRLARTLEHPLEVGLLRLRVLQASGLRPADFNGSSDPFVVVRLVNTRLQTHTLYKTVEPNWNKTFLIPVSDVSSVLEIRVFDENRNRAPEFLGAVDLPLLGGAQSGRRWFQLRDEKLKGNVKGSIELETHLAFNWIRAGYRLLQPKEEIHRKKKPVKANVKLLRRNYDRACAALDRASFVARVANDVLAWQSPFLSIVAFIVFVVVVVGFDFWWIPLSAAVALIAGGWRRGWGKDEEKVEEARGRRSRDEEEEKKGGGKKGMADQTQLLMDLAMQMQVLSDLAAAFTERVRNLFNWTTPFLSAFALAASVAGVLVVYIVPARWLVLLLGLHMMTKKFRDRHPLEQHTLLDFLARVPSNEERESRRRLPPARRSRSASRRSRT